MKHGKHWLVSTRSVYLLRKPTDDLASAAHLHLLWNRRPLDLDRQFFRLLIMRRRRRQKCLLSNWTSLSNILFYFLPPVPEMYAVRHKVRLHQKKGLFCFATWPWHTDEERDEEKREESRVFRSISVVILFFFFTTPSSLLFVCLGTDAHWGLCADIFFSWHNSSSSSVAPRLFCFKNTVSVLIKSQRRADLSADLSAALGRLTTVRRDFLRGSCVAEISKLETAHIEKALGKLQWKKYSLALCMKEPVTLKAWSSLKPQRKTSSSIVAHGFDYRGNIFLLVVFILLPTN